jgi:hypothetical protein
MAIGWMVSVTVTDSGQAIGQKLYAVGLNDPEEAKAAALEASGGELASISYAIDDGVMRNLKLGAGQLICMMDVGTSPESTVH